MALYVFGEWMLDYHFLDEGSFTSYPLYTLGNLYFFLMNSGTSE